ncbi:MAG: hypothetical protein A2885_09505 [Sphingopyxis sp. RIFCSPHIGHO2_01_FULL_65_24]|nr:MAG: hypothetical protein A2885_09505 [Sphingopyxis sp. RIFCSPHIGHO2_01_FULL_65_24]
MARLMNRLNARSVETVNSPGLHADGGGLYLTTKGGGRRWVFIFRWQNKRREMGLGPLRDVPLARARELAAGARALLADGINPIDARTADKAARAAGDQSADKPLTFGEFSETYIASVEQGWRNEVHRRQWRSTLRDHAGILAGKPIAEIGTEDVLQVLRPIWLVLPETASRVRGRIERILAAAKAHEFRSRDAANPAQWRGHLDVLLPKQSKMKRGHHSAMPYADLPAFITKLRERPATAARALEFLILNASRTSEVLHARWQEIEGNTWVIPPERMKAGVPHTVTLAPAAISLLGQIGPHCPENLLFHVGENAPLSNMAMQMLLRRMGEERYTVHGFRSAFKDWAANCTEFADEISEEALAHTVGSKVRRAYRRGEALDRRRTLMSAWANFLCSESSKTEAQL